MKLPSLGPEAFVWTAEIGGSPYSGANDYRGATGWFSEMGGKPQTSKLAQLVKLAIAA
jgi:hypothetical protein